MVFRLLCWLLVAVACVACNRTAATFSGEHTFAELRAIKGSLTVQPEGSAPRLPFRRERLVDKEVVTLQKGALAWIRRDGGATWLVSGPGTLTVGEETMRLSGGRTFVDTEQGESVTMETPHGAVELSGARVSLEVGEKETTAYVLRGSARVGSRRATAGEMLTIRSKGEAEKKAVVSWQDWTGGLGTADPTAAPAPFGIGTVGARPPGDQGKPRSALLIERLQVSVTIDHDLALTEVDQTFVNPTSETVEGIYRFRTPQDAVLSKFGVDRDGRLVWGRVKESRSAEQVYESHVYQGSTEDPALLKWEAPGIYTARLYPIAGGEKRRVVTRYSQWLSRQGEKGERRLYVYPMAAEGAKGTLPRIEEMSVDIDVSGSGAKHVRSGMGGVREGDHILVKAFDFIPQADLSVELFDDGSSRLQGFRAPHELGQDEVPEGMDEGFAREVSQAETDYVAVPLRVPARPGDKPGLDIAIVVDTSAATEPAALAIGRALASSLLSHLGPEDRAALWAGDAALRPVATGSDKLSQVTDELRKKWLSGLASVERGGATDLGALLTGAATLLEAKRPGAVIYIGDGAPSVGEIAPDDLRKRLERLPIHTRIFPVAVGSQPNAALLEQVARGAPVELVEDAYGAARVSLRVLESVSRSTWLGAQIDLGPGVERVLPEVIPPLTADETVLIVGRRTGKLPSEITLTGSGGKTSRPISFEVMEDRGDLRRRWGNYRLGRLLEGGAGRSTLVDLSLRFGLVSPFTSLYVPTRAEEQQAAYVALEEEESYETKEARRKRWKPWSSDAGLTSVAREMAPSPLEMASAVDAADNTEGGTGTRAKGEEGSMGSSASSGANRRYAVQGPKDAPPAPPPVAQEEALASGGLGLLGSAAEPRALESPAASDRDGVEDKKMEALQAPAPSKPTASSAPRGKPGDPMGNMWGADVDEESRHPTGLGLVRPGSGGGGIRSRLDEKPVEDKLEEKQANSPPRQAKSMGQIGHAPIPCGRAADLPLPERRTLWSERLSGRSPEASVEIYRSALASCEATSWRERVALLVLMVDQLSTVADRVALFRSLLQVSPGAADAVYRFLMLRVRTAAQLKELHDALGFEQIDPDVLQKLLAQAEDPRERLTLLRGSAEKFPDDSELALQVLEAYEDARDEAGGRAWARKLRARVDATSHLRTSVGEYYLRLFDRARDKKSIQALRDQAEGRRTFGEIVEFAPEDPLARRHLGDLLLAHGWFDEALRQYETLERLTPDDTTVHLLLARAAQGTGKTERAVRLTEKSSQAGAPDSQEPVSVAARALASVFLAEARLAALKAGKKDELLRLRARAGRLAAEKEGAGVRVVLTWSHPELRAALWTNALGSMMPARDNLPLLGVAEAQLAMAPPPRIEIRLDPRDAEHAARLGLKAQLTVLFGEGSDDEAILLREVPFRRSDDKAREVIAWELDGRQLKEVE